MKKTLLLAITLLAITSTLQSQVRFGLRGGISTTDVDPSALLILNQQALEDFRFELENARYGLHIGALLCIGIGNFYIQPELLFNSNSVDYQVTDFTSPLDPVNAVLREKYQFLDVPVLFGTKLGPLRINVGPEAHVFINSTSEILDFITEYDQNFDRLTFGWLGGIGLKIWNVMLDFRYEGNFSNFGDHITIGGRDFNFDDRPSRFIFSVAFLFGD